MKRLFSFFAVLFLTLVSYSQIQAFIIYEPPELYIPAKMKAPKAINKRIRSRQSRLRKKRRKLKSIIFDSIRVNNLKKIKLPASLLNLDMSLSDIKTYEGFNLPAGLKYLSVASPTNSNGDFSSLKLTENLEILYLGGQEAPDPNSFNGFPSTIHSMGYGFALTNLDQMVVSDSIKNIFLDDSGITDSEDWSLIPNGLNSLTISGKVQDFRSIENIQLPQDIKGFELVLFQGLFVGGAIDYDELNLPSNLEYLALEAGDSNSIKYTGVNLPSNLRTLSINTSRTSYSYLSELQLPQGLKVIVFDNLDESFDAGVGAAILEMDFPEGLERLDLKDQFIYDLKDLDIPSSLIELDLQGCKISSLENLSNVTYPDSLRRIYLSENPLNRKKATRVAIRSFFKENYPNIDLEFNFEYLGDNIVPFVLYDEDKVSASL